jgi:hypothetical protein
LAWGWDLVTVGLRQSVRDWLMAEQKVMGKDLGSVKLMGLEMVARMVTDLVMVMAMDWVTQPLKGSVMGW